MDQPAPISEDWILIAEGQADYKFFRAITTKRQGFKKFDIRAAKGLSTYVDLLRGLRADQASFSRVKGFLITADSADNPNVTFRNICGQLREAGGYGIPNALQEIVSAPGYPPLAILTLPNEATPGGLESLLVKEIEGRHPTLRGCVEAYLRCENIRVMDDWDDEPRDKAIFHCMIAATNKEDPSKAASYVFKEPTPVISVLDPCFDDIAAKVQAFCAAVETGSWRSTTNIS